MAYVFRPSKKKRMPPNVNERILKERLRKAQELVKQAKNDLWLYRNDPGLLVQKRLGKIQSPKIRQLIADIRKRNGI